MRYLWTASLEADWRCYWLPLDASMKRLVKRSNGEMASRFVPERHVNLGMVRYYARDFDLGLADMEQALTLSPNFGPALIGKGQIFVPLEGTTTPRVTCDRRSPFQQIPGTGAAGNGVHASGPVGGIE